MEVNSHLTVVRWEGEACLREYLKYLIKIDRVVKLFFDNRVMRALVQAAPALKELALLGKITSGPRRIGPPLPYDELVVDCYATGHFRALWRAPVGLAEAIPFGPMGEQSRSIVEVIRNPAETKIYVVALPEDLPVTEGLELARDVESELGQRATIVLNRWLESPLDLAKLKTFEGHAFADYLAILLARQTSARETLARSGREVITLPWIFAAKDRRPNPAAGAAVGVQMIAALKAHRVLICAGTGGVGKTSLSASLGVLAANAGLRTLVLTIDPAHRLAQSLGIEDQPGQDVAVAGVPGLSASMIDPRIEFNAFVLGALDNALAEGLLKNRLYQQLASNLNGSQEFTSLVRLLKAARDPRYDLIILDTPPTQNAVDFLRAPDRLCALFQDTVIGWFANPVAETGWIKRTLHRGTRLVTSALEGVTGSTFIAELKDFFTHISHLRGQISGRQRRR